MANDLFCPLAKDVCREGVCALWHDWKCSVAALPDVAAKAAALRDTLTRINVTLETASTPIDYTDAVKNKK